MGTMYIPPAFQQTDREILHALIRANPLGMLVTVWDSVPDANHVPFLLSDEGHLGTLRGHVARTNGVWKGADNRPALVVFRGSDGYISPAWYRTKSETGKVVPTWNYTVVHARGPLRVVDDIAWLRDHVTSLVAEHESHRDRPWTVADAPADYIEAMLGAIIGIELPIERASCAASPPSVPRLWRSPNPCDDDESLLATLLAGALAIAGALPGCLTLDFIDVDICESDQTAGRTRRRRTPTSIGSRVIGSLPAEHPARHRRADKERRHQRHAVEYVRRPRASPPHA
jgi:transcriptional regulator